VAVADRLVRIDGSTAMVIVGLARSAPASAMPIRATGG
jgi:hypothetical protein